MSLLSRNRQPARQTALRMLLMLSVLLAAQISSCSNSSEAKTAGGFQAVSPERQLHTRDPSTVDPSAADPSAADPSAADPSAADPGTVDPGPTPRSSSTATSQAKPPSSTDKSAQGLRQQNLPDSAQVLIVQQLLARYSQIVTELAAQPEASIDPLSATRVLFNALVPPQNPLSTDVLNQLVVTPAEEHTRVLPAPNGLSYSYKPIRVGPVVDGTISFSWCGYSPGVRVTQGTEAVIDESIAQLNGTGSARLVGKDWLIESLDHLDLKLLPAGSSDPCPPPTATETQR